MISKANGIRYWTALGFISVSRISIIISVLLGIVIPAYAHHASGGKISASFLEGFLSGLAHPVIGLDHLVFVISIGLLASTIGQGYWIPLSFISTALVGTGLHLTLINMPMIEVFISASVIVFGILLAKLEKINIAIIVVLAGVAGLFHGYAYGEAIIGAAAVPLAAYLLGFTLTQLLITFSAYKAATTIQKSSIALPNFLRFAGFIAIGSGMTFLASSF